ncbi:ERCC4 domain-containing protein [Aeropyrum camini]|uniref:DNA repair endonuclease XPF n=1 Tax=Aeropyrum camini SY1 = JCM 12091 TaxID=1198449 RepID=U3TGB4_9CREN|nr:ERCC4 domain-containing protein [Aeropyrum camini]BAN90369.1 DNA repair endonuclease XPF [Aeropyrum camini SY1 = JCM 12091]
MESGGGRSGGQRPRVYADVREEKSPVPAILESLGVRVIVRQLPMGDYLVSDSIVVERKTSNDFARSLFDGRLFEQASRLAEHYDIVFIIIEGPPVPRRYRGRERSLYASMVSLQLDYGVRIMNTMDPRGTALAIESLARFSSRGGGQRIVIHKKPRLSDIREWQLYILQSFPGIGRRTAERILERFGSLERFLTASKAEISKVEGIGEKRAEDIKRILMTPYRTSPSGAKRPASLEDFYKRGGEGDSG